ncbi:MAG: UDP-N-acetylglucosamine--N-acetylmuramyl-(pentapeptide) pyrophosphoryl-undecaprenol N-acetylglucosamine transferase [Candidatus Falkowbacteria bacterium]
MENIKKRTIMFSGGGTGGPVTPLLAVASELLRDDKNLNLIFVGTKTGPVEELIDKFKDGKIKFITIPSGKLRRYFSWQNFLDLFKIISAFFKSLKVLRSEKPDLVISAGGFVSVPLVWAAAAKKIPILIHQQDMRAGLANKLMAPFARVITVTFEKSLMDYGPRAVLTGNPLKDISHYLQNTVETRNRYGFKIDKPLVMVIGGGTGAVAINNLIAESLPELLLFSQVVHLTGQGKKPIVDIKNNNYQNFEFLSQDEVLSLMATSDLIISRCGFGTLTEIATLARPTILIPMPHTHQEDNANLFKSREAAIYLDQTGLTAQKLIEEIQKIISDAKLRGSLSHNISKIMKPDAAQNIAAIIWEMIK